jgi:hypothetical protein
VILSKAFRPGTAKSKNCIETMWMMLDFCLLFIKTGSVLIAGEQITLELANFS